MFRKSAREVLQLSQSRGFLASQLTCMSVLRDTAVAGCHATTAPHVTPVLEDGGGALGTLEMPARFRAERQLSASSSRYASATWRRHITMQSAVPERVDSTQKEADINSADLKVLKTLRPKSKPELSDLTFGKHYTDHMLHVAWKKGEGWSAPSIHPLTGLDIHPCAQGLQYGMQCFEGLKAYMGCDGEIRLFRPRMNMNRLARSCTRLSLPSFDQDQLLECIKHLVRVERDWLPKEEGYALYLRPTVIGTTPFIGVGPPSDAMLYVAVGPAGPYYQSGMKAIRLAINTDMVRAYPGGVGSCKVGGNYAPTIAPLVNAQMMGCSQVLFTFNDKQPGGPLLSEVGAMNIFVVLRKEDGSGIELVTPRLDGSILPGVTRDSILTIAQTWEGVDVSERDIRLGEVVRAEEEGRLLEMFTSGTASSIVPVNMLVNEAGYEVRVPFDEKAAHAWLNDKSRTAVLQPSEGEPFSMAGRMSRALLDIQHGHTEFREWSVPVGN